MDELIRDFRSEVPDPGADSIRAARATLAARMSRGPWWRRRFVVAIAVTLVAAVAAGAALGLGDRLVDLIRGKPAPESFQRMMEATQERYPVFGYEITGDWRGVTATATPIGPAGIYVAPASRGICWHAIVTNEDISELRGHLVGACGPPSPRQLFEVGVMPYQDGGRFDRTAPTGRTLDVLVGRVGQDASRLAVHLCDGRRPVRVPVRESFVLAVIPEGREVDRIVAFDPQGARLGQTRPPGPGGAPTFCP
jgi:hypothetical protein